MFIYIVYRDGMKNVIKLPKSLFSRVPVINVLLIDDIIDVESISYYGVGSRIFKSGN